MNSLTVGLVVISGCVASYCLQQIRKNQTIIELLADAVMFQPNQPDLPNGIYHQQLHLEAAEPLIDQGSNFVTACSPNGKLFRQPLIKSQKHIEPLVPFMHNYHREQKGPNRIPQRTFFHVFAHKKGDIFDANQSFIVTTEPCNPAKAIRQARTCVSRYQMMLYALGLGAIGSMVYQCIRA